MVGIVAGRKVTTVVLSYMEICMQVARCLGLFVLWWQMFSRLLV